MSDRTTIKVAKNGPYLVTGAKRIAGFADGKVYDSAGTVALCRCGASKSKPYCDGAHAKIGFCGDKSPDRVADKRENYVGKGITIHDNRGICAHSARCTDGLKSVFRLGQEPWIDPDGDTVDRVVAQIKECPSGALSYTIDGVEHRDQERDAAILIAPNGPYAILGGADLEATEFGEGASREHFDLCRCGKSKNKPFCSGAHWNHQFDEHAPEKEG